MKEETMKLQNTVNGDWSVAGEDGGQTFHFAVDTCTKMKEYTHNDACKDKDLSIDSFSVSTKISSEFFSGETYASNDHTLSSDF